MNRAAIAIGSNSTRMLTRLDDGREYRGREYTHLFMGLTPDKLLTAQAMEDTVRAVLRLKALAESTGADAVRLYATSAVRDAGNSEVFSRLLLARTGLTLTVIDGRTEASLAFRAASRGRDCAVLDIGGGSTELSYGRDGHLTLGLSAQEGAARLCRAEALGDRQAADRAIDALCGRLRGVFGPLLKTPAPAILVAIGGTALTAAAVYIGTESHGDELEGTVVPARFADELLTRLLPLSNEERAQIPGLYPSRAPVMPHGLCILLAVLRLTGFDSFTLSTRNNLDALICLP